MGFFDKRIPTIIGLLTIIISLVTGIYLASQKQLFGGKPDPLFTPKKIKITNVADNQFTVSWISSKAATGFIRYGTTPSVDSSLPDDRDQRSGQKQAFKSHYVTISGLKPTTKYYFKIGSGEEKNLFDNNGKPYEVTTGPTLGAQPPSDLINGKVVSETGSPATGAIVYITLPNTALLSAQVKADGTWLIALSSARVSDLSDYASYDSALALIDIFAQGEEKTAKAITNTANDSPVPQITLGQTHDFTNGATQTLAQGETPSSETTVPETIPESTSKKEGQFPLQPLTNFPVEASPSAEVTLTNPQTEGETINSLRPEIIGTGPPRKVLTITIESKTYTTTVVVDDEGNWSFTPPEDLEAGTHTITIAYVDDGGQEQSLQRNFVVAAPGDSGLPAFTATPSAITTPSARTSVPSTDSGVPLAGTVNPTMLMLFLGLILTISGFALKLRQAHPL